MLKLRSFYGSFHSNPIRCKTCGILLNEGMLWTWALTGAQALPLPWEIALDSSTSQEVKICTCLVTKEGMLGPLPLTAAWAFALAWKRLLKSCTLQAVKHDPY